MATATVSKAVKGAKESKATKAAVVKAVPTKAEPKEVAYNGFCIARSFHTKLAEAQAAQIAAKAGDKDDTFRWSIYRISAKAKDATLPEGTEGSDRDGFAVAVGFDRSAVKAAAMLKEASKGGKFKALQILATKDHAKGTKQPTRAAKE